MQKTGCFVFLLLISPLILRAQTAEEVSIKEVINRLFLGMYKGDSAIVRSVFAKEVTMATAFRNKEGIAVLKRE